MINGATTPPPPPIVIPFLVIGFPLSTVYVYASGCMQFDLA